MQLERRTRARAILITARRSAIIFVRRCNLEYTGEGIEALVAAVEEIENASLIMTDKKIRALLKCLAYYEEFRTVIEYCSKGADYPAEKKKALVRKGEYRAFRLPKSPTSVVVLGVGLLTEFDSGTADFLDFCSDWFPAESKQGSLERCCREFFEPFKFALAGLVVEGIKEEVPLVDREVEFAHDGLQEQAEYLLVALVRGVNEGKMSETDRGELLTMLEGFSAALDSRDILMIKAVWLGIKRSLAAYKLCADEIVKTDELLRLYLVSK